MHVSVVNSSPAGHNFSYLTFATRNSPAFTVPEGQSIPMLCSSCCRCIFLCRYERIGVGYFIARPSTMELMDSDGDELSAA